MSDAFSKPPEWFAVAVTDEVYPQLTPDETDAAIQKIWDAVVANARCCHLDRLADPRDDGNPMGAIGLLMTKRPQDDALFLPVVALMLRPPA